MNHLRFHLSFCLAMAICTITTIVIGAPGRSEETPNRAASPVAPGLVAPANAATGQYLSLALQWSAVPGALNYEVQVSTNSSFSTLALDSGPMGATNFNISLGTLSSGTQYYWRVNASDGISTSPWSDTWSFTTQQLYLAPATTKWKYLHDFANLSGGLGVHGLAVDPSGNVWVALYGATDNIPTPSGSRPVSPVYVFSPNGQQVSFSPIKIITANGVSDTLFSPARGLSTDRDGNILYVSAGTLYRINYRTGQGMTRVVPQGYVVLNALTAPAGDQAGNVYVGHVWVGNSVQAFDPNFNFLENVLNVSSGFSRTLAVSPNGQNVYWPEYDLLKLSRLNSPGGPPGPYTYAGSVVNGFAIESMTWHPKTGKLWISSGSDYSPPLNPYPIMTWYGIDPSNGNITDTLGWYPTPGTLSGRPRAIAFSPTGDTAYVGCFNLNSNALQMFFQTSSSSALELGNSALFDGGASGSRLRTLDTGPNNPAANPAAYQINGSALTVEAWVYPMGYPDPQNGSTIVARPLSTIQTDPGTSYRLFVYHGNGFAQPAFSISAGTPGSRQIVLSPDSLPAFQWTHLAGTYDGTTLRIYMNGVLKGQYSTNISIASTPGVGLYIGRFLTDRFQGAIDELRLWNITRSQSDIQGSMNTTLTGGEPGLAGYWKMDTSQVVNGHVVVQDQTANHNDLLIQGPTPLIPFNPLTISPPATFSIAPPSFNFGTVEEGVGSTQNLSITNTGTGPLLGVVQLTSSSAQLAGGGAFYIAAGQTQNNPVTVRGILPGSLSGTLMLNTNGGTPTPIPFTLTSIALRRFDANNIGMWTLRDGRFATDPVDAPPGNLNAGFEWPRGSGKTALFASGLWVGAIVNGNVRTAIAGYRSEFQPGPINGVGGTAPNPNDTTYRVYKISAGDNAATNPDYATWPASLGAPVNPDGTPKVIGSQTLFAVYNDLNPALHSYGTAPLGAEVQQTTFGFNQPGSQSNTVFVSFRITNKSSTPWSNTYVSLWSDPDLGDAGDDLVGIDTARNLGYCYNGTNTDAVYGTPPPAVGYNILKGAFFTKPIQAFSYFINGAGYPHNDPGNGLQAYNYMQGLWEDGSPFIDSTTMMPSRFVFTGDPVASTGWLDHYPADRRFQFSTGPFDLAPGESKELVAAILVGQGTSNLNSITALRTASDDIQSLYNGGQIYGGALVNVSSATAPAGTSDTLNDVAQSGAQITFTGGTGGATVEEASYLDAPPGVTSITTPSVGGVGKYLDLQVQGTVQWPIAIKLYYTRNDLLQAGVVESDLQGVYYWSGSTSQWVLYSNSGADDQGRGTSTTGVDTTNVTVNGIDYEGFVWAAAYHLTPLTVGAKKKTIAQRYSDAIHFIRSLPDNALKKPADQRRKQLADMLAHSDSMFVHGRLADAIDLLTGGLMNHLTPEKHSSEDVWITDPAARGTLIGMINDLVDVLQRVQNPGASLLPQYTAAIQYVQSLPDSAFRKPADQRRKQLADMLARSDSMYVDGKVDDAIEMLAEEIMNHLTSGKPSGEDVWVTDASARGTLVHMINDLVDALRKVRGSDESSSSMMAAGVAAEIPAEYGLSQNYPNPFNPSTTIRYQLPQAGPVTLKVYNVLGEEVAVLVSGYQNPGYYQVRWNAAQMPTGVYLYRLQAGSFVQTRKLLLLK